MKVKPAPPLIHEHRWVETNPFHREADRCKDCGVYRFEFLGAFERRKARLRAYEEMGRRLE